MQTKRYQKSKMKKVYLLAPVLMTVLLLFALQITGQVKLFSRPSRPTSQTTTQEDRDKKASTINDSTIPVTTNAQPVTSPKNGTADTTYHAPDDNNGITFSAAKTGPSEVTITTKLEGYSDGTCSLSIENGTNSLSIDAPIIYQSDYSTCAGFVVPLSKLGSGKWDIKLSVLSGGVTQTKTLSYEALR